MGNGKGRLHVVNGGLQTQSYIVYLLLPQAKLLDSFPPIMPITLKRSKWEKDGDISQGG